MDSSEAEENRAMKGRTKRNLIELVMLKRLGVRRRKERAN